MTKQSAGKEEKNKVKATLDEVAKVIIAYIIPMFAISIMFLLTLYFLRLVEPRALNILKIPTPQDLALLAACLWFVKGTLK